MLMQGINNQQTGDQFNTNAKNQQNVSLLGAPPIQSQAMASSMPGQNPSFDPQMLNSSQISPQVSSMVNALRGGM